MPSELSEKVESEHIEGFAEAMKAGFSSELFSSDLSSGMSSVLSSTASPTGQEPSSAGRLNLAPDNVKNGLGQLVLTLVKLLHELLERQALRRMDAGSLSEEEIERLGIALMKQAREIDRLCREFGLEEEDLNLDLGPLGRLL